MLPETIQYPLLNNIIYGLLKVYAAYLTSSSNLPDTSQTCRRNQWKSTGHFLTSLTTLATKGTGRKRWDSGSPAAVWSPPIFQWKKQLLKGVLEVTVFGWIWYFYDILMGFSLWSSFLVSLIVFICLKPILSQHFHGGIYTKSGMTAGEMTTRY